MPILRLNKEEACDLMIAVVNGERDVPEDEELFNVLNAVTKIRGYHRGKEFAVHVTAEQGNFYNEHLPERHRR